LGYDVITIDGSVSREKARASANGKTVQGDFKPQLLVSGEGTSEEVRAAYASEHISSTSSTWTSSICAHSRLVPLPSTLARRSYSHSRSLRSQVVQEEVKNLIQGFGGKEKLIVNLCEGLGGKESVDLVRVFVDAVHAS